MVKKSKEIVAVAEPAKKPKRRNNHGKNGWKSYVKRYCKDKKLPHLNTDAHKIVQTYADNLLNELLDHCQSLFKNSENSKMFTDETIKLAVQSFANQRDVDPKTVKSMLQYSDNAFEKIAKKKTDESK
jgi:hypothetical protein